MELEHTQDLLHLHNAGVGPDVVDSLGLLDLILLVKDIIESDVGLGRGVIHCGGRERQNSRKNGRDWVLSSRFAG